jgi:hypothetical protein
MADTADIAFVIDNIEPEYAMVSNWDEAEIALRLDEGALRERVVAAYWTRRAAQVIKLVNTSESGSSRANDSLYPRFKQLSDEWSARALALENPPSESLSGRLGSFPIRRV